MTNQEAFEAARAGDWIAESFTRSGDVFTLGGKSAGYSSFADCLDDGQSIFYAAFDEDDNREAGLAIWDAAAKTLTPVEIHATLVGGAFIKGDPDPLQFTKGGTITGTFNATGFNTIWRHVFEKGNPHETQADEIDQSNDKMGDTVQDALNWIAGVLGQIDPDGDTDIDWGDIDGLKDVLDSKADKTALDQEIKDRKAADEVLQAQIDAIDPDADSDVDWSDVSNKPDTFPPSAHGHDQSDIDGLEDRLDAIEGSVSDGGGFVEAPNDGKLYGRQSSAWAEVVIPEQTDPTWDSITGKPSEFPPAAHNHDGVYQPVGNYVTEAPNDGKQYVRESEAWAEIDIPEPANNLEGGWAYNSSAAGEGEWTSRNADWLVPTTITLHKTDAAGYDHNFALMNDGDVIYVQAPLGGAEYEILDVSATADSATFDVKCLSRFGDFPGEGDATSITFIPQVSGGAVKIGETFEGTPSEGDQWLETPAGGEAVMWVYDGEKWLQMPGGGGSGQAGGITTATLPLANPTREATGLSTQSDANNYFADAIAKVINDDGDVALTGYYTKDEADSAFQPKGSYIEDAPSNGDLYVRKNGAWEKFTPSSGGGGGYMEPVEQPASIGVFSSSNKAGRYQNGDVTPGEITLAIPDGVAFILHNIECMAPARVKASEIFIDGIQCFPSYSQNVDNQKLFDPDGEWICRNELKFRVGNNGPGSNTVYLYGIFIPDDSVFYGLEENSAGTQEVADE